MNSPNDKDRRDAELDEEIRSHLAMDVAARLARGEAREAAEHASRREFGNATHVAEVTREMWGAGTFERVVRDVRVALRRMARAPSFSVVAILTLALGIGANTAVFTVVHGVLLRPLPFRDADRLMLVSYRNPKSSFPGPPAIDEGTFKAFQREQKSFEHVAFFSWNSRTLTERGDPARVNTGLVTADFMKVLGAQAMMGRTFLPDDEQPGSDHVAVLGRRFWQSRFAGDSAIVNKAVTLDGERYTIIGVMPDGFAFPYDAEVWTPIQLGRSPTRVWVRPTVGRLKPGVQREDALREFERIVEAMKLPGEGVARVMPLAELVTADVRKSLLLFAGAVSLVLLIACANVANLLLLRAHARRREIGIRAALGAARGRLVREMLTESAVISVIGGLAGVILSFWGVRVLLAIAPEGRIPRMSEIQVDGTVLAATLAASLLAGLACGIVPAIIATRRELRETIGEGARTLTGGHEPVRRGLVIAELALAIVLLSGAGLLVKSSGRIRAVDPGFDPSNLHTLSVNLPDGSYKGFAERRAFHAQVLEQLAAIPGVASAAAANWVPMTPMFVAGDFTIENGPPMPKGYVVAKLTSTPGYFRTLGIPVAFGRDFDARDTDGSVPVVIVTRSIAKQFWPPTGEASLGKRITQADDPKPEDWLTIVGVVDDVVQRDLKQARTAALYQPAGQVKSNFFLGDFTYVVRVSGQVAGVPAAMREVVRRSGPTLPVGEVAPMARLIDLTMADQRFEARLLAVFSLLALGLAAIGIYGVLASDIASRSHEIGLRMALGASRSSVVRMVLRRTAMLVVPGLAIGVFGAFFLTGILTKSLYGVKPTDPATFMAVSALLGLVALVAAMVPARRAIRIDPIRALRHE